MTRTQQILRGIGLALMFFVLALILLFVLALFGNASFELVAHFLAGFVFFLKDHLPRISSDHATWLPGIAAFLIATGFAHLLLKRLVRSRGRVWKIKTTVCLTLFLPVLFVVSFIVPGALLQVDTLRGIKWFNHSNGSAKAFVTTEIRNLALWIQADAEMRNLQKYPDSLEEIDFTDFPRLGWIRNFGDAQTPIERPIYLGAGMPIDSESDAALLISPSFQQNEGWRRVVIAFNGKTSVIPAAEAEVWIDRALETRH